MLSENCEPKFSLLYRLLQSIDTAKYRYIVVVDDDIELPAHFLDRYLAGVLSHDFALAQPARTSDSFIDHYFVSQLHGVEARATRFVEIGPLFSIRSDALPLLTLFDAESPMGWGYDFVWPLQIEAAGLSFADDEPLLHCAYWAAFAASKLKGIAEEAQARQGEAGGVATRAVGAHP